MSTTDALERGLVDRLGGLQDAARRAAELAGVPSDRIKLRTVPRVTPLDRLRPPQSSETPTAAAWAPAITSAAPPSGPDGLLRTLLAASGAVVPGVLTLPGSWDLR
jgi:protease-4